MCLGCFTGEEATVLQGTAGVVFARSEIIRWRERLTGQDPADRRRAAYDVNAEFLESLGLDPVRVLGSAPACPAPSTSPSTDVD